MIGLPNYIVNAEINSRYINYVWDDSNVSQPFDFNIAPQFITKLEPASLRAKIALVIGCYEWVLGRFSKITDQSLFLQIQEVVWCANINKNYIRQDLFYERNGFLGPVQGALWCAYSCVIPVVYVSEGLTEADLENDDPDFFVDDYLYDENEWKKSLRFLIPLIVHILPTEKVYVFLTWLENITKRLIDLYTMPEEGPFDNLWGHKNDKDWLGNYVAREALDPDYNYRPEQAIPLLNHFLEQVDKRNPLLNSLPILEKKIKTPFRIED